MNAEKVLKRISGKILVMQKCSVQEEHLSAVLASLPRQDIPLTGMLINVKWVSSIIPFHYNFFFAVF